MTDSFSQPVPGSPYVGPRSFIRGETIYGRDREIQRLLHLLIAERIVALYSPSGAGKTSLIQAGLIPRLEQEAFAVLPVVRLSLEPPASDGATRLVEVTPNRYVQSAILSLEEGQPPDQRVPLAELGSLDLPTYLVRRCESRADGVTEWVLVFDQFEEILTIDPTDEAFSPDGNLLASAGTDGVIRLWHTPRIGSQFTRSQEPLGTALPNPTATQGMRRVAFAPDGQKLASILDNNSIGVWNFAAPIDGKPSRVDFAPNQASDPPQASVRAIAYNPDGTLLATAGCATPSPCTQGSVSFWNAATHDPAGSSLTVNGSEIISLAFSPDMSSHRLVSGGAQGDIRLWDFTTRTQMGDPFTPSGDSTPVRSVAFSPDADSPVLATARTEGSVELWDVASRQRTAVLEDAGEALGVNNLAFNDNGTLLAAACNAPSCGPGKIFVWNVATHKRIEQSPTGQVGIVNDVAFTGPSTVAAVSADGTLRLWDVANDKPYGQPLFAYPFALDGAAFNRLTGLLATSSGTTYSGNQALDDKVVVWNMQSGRWPALACGIANRNLSVAEWTRFVGVDAPYTPVCPSFPPGKGAPH